MNTCRFCKKVYGDWQSDRLVKYGRRHYACQPCYLDAGKKLADLPKWQIGQFAYRLLDERGLLEEARRLTEGTPR